MAVLAPLRRRGAGSSAASIPSRSDRRPTVDDGPAADPGRIARPLHPIAWWIWALALATAASRTTNPLVLLLLIAAAGQVVLARRGDAPWARAFRAYLVLGLIVVGIRVVFAALLGAGEDGTVLLRLPQVPLPQWAAGIELGGAVTVQDVLAAGYDGLRLAALICCVGAANTLADPKRALRSMPAALYEVGAAVVVAVSVAPQLVESVLRVRRARRLRGGRESGFRALRGIAVPVLQDALDRSLALAAAMDSRGYGRSAHLSRRTRAVNAALLLTGLIALCLATYGLLDGSVGQAAAERGDIDPSRIALVVGVLVSAAGLWSGGRRLQRTRYRPDPWHLPEWIVAGSGVLAAAVVLRAAQLDPVSLHPSVDPVVFPNLPTAGVIAVVLALVPAVAAPPPRRSAPS